ncbi:MAG: tetraacyldisaccharide 4'-kinase [Lentisphaerae bacterium]|nr:tetraacyldisaccharide 4'-kinase [Lentisphaerota bacterium]
MVRRVWEQVERFLVSKITAPGDGRGETRPVRALLRVLDGLSHVYRGAIRIRLFLYTHGIFRHHTLGCQVISIGNLTVGGTGKTPVVEVFARELQQAGRKVAVLSRGYKKEEPPLARRLIDLLLFREWRRPPRVVSDGRTLLLDSAMSGDEPYMLASNLPDVAVLVDKNRIKSGRYAIKKLGCDTLVLDDGFQYMALKHRMEIVLVDWTNPFGNGHVLPRGILREPVGNIARADFMFITKCEAGRTAALRSHLRALNPRAEIVECKHATRHLENVFTGVRRNLGFLRGLDVTVLSGIAAPESFECAIEERGARIVDRRRFADHHRYTQQELIDIINTSSARNAAAIITTEKDAVRFPKLERRDIPIYFLRVEIEILSGTEDFRTCISRICFR